MGEGVRNWLGLAVKVGCLESALNLIKTDLSPLLHRNAPRRQPLQHLLPSPNILRKSLIRKSRSIDNFPIEFDHVELIGFPFPLGFGLCKTLLLVWVEELDSVRVIIV